jgi:hypothetical protein
MKIEINRPLPTPKNMNPLGRRRKRGGKIGKKS